MIIIGFVKHRKKISNYFIVCEVANLPAHNSQILQQAFLQLPDIHQATAQQTTVLDKDRAIFSRMIEI